MRHRKAGYKLNRKREHRTAMLRNMAASLIEHGQITTTIPKAKALQPFIEKLITRAKKNDIYARRICERALGGDRILADNEDDITRNRYGELKTGPKLVRRLFEDVAPRFTDRAGGYTRIVKLGVSRLGDATELCVIQFVGDEEGPEIGGRPSTRRRTADKRTAFAAKARKAAASSKKGAPTEKAEAGAGEDETAES